MTFDDVYYAASLIEYIGRVTKNHREDVVRALQISGLVRLLKLASIYHCLSIESAAAEFIDRYNISVGDYDTVSSCKYSIPSYLAIGKVFARLIDAVAQSPDEYAEVTYRVFCSGIADAITNFNSALYFSSSEEVAYHYRTRYAS